MWPVLMAGLSTRGKVLQSWPLLSSLPSLSSNPLSHIKSVNVFLSKVWMYFYLKCEYISMKTGRPLNSWKSVAKLAAALLPSLFIILSGKSVNVSSNPSSCPIHFNYCKCYYIQVNDDDGDNDILNLGWWCWPNRLTILNLIVSLCAKFHPIINHLINYLIKYLNCYRSVNIAGVPYFSLCRL